MESLELLDRKNELIKQALDALQHLDDYKEEQALLADDRDDQVPAAPVLVVATAPTTPKGPPEVTKSSGSSKKRKGKKKTNGTASDEDDFLRREKENYVRSYERQQIQKEIEAEERKMHEMEKAKKMGLPLDGEDSDGSAKAGSDLAPTAAGLPTPSRTPSPSSSPSSAEAPEAPIIAAVDINEVLSLPPPKPTLSGETAPLWAELVEKASKSNPAPDMRIGVAASQASQDLVVEKALIGSSDMPMAETSLVRAGTVRVASPKLPIEIANPEQPELFPPSNDPIPDLGSKRSKSFSNLVSLDAEPAFVALAKPGLERMDSGIQRGMERYPPLPPVEAFNTGDLGPPPKATASAPLERLLKPAAAPSQPASPAALPTPSVLPSQAVPSPVLSPSPAPLTSAIPPESLSPAPAPPPKATPLEIFDPPPKRSSSLRQSPQGTNVKALNPLPPPRVATAPKED